MINSTSPQVTEALGDVNTETIKTPILPGPIGFLEVNLLTSCETDPSIGKTDLQRAMSSDRSTDTII